MWNGSRKQAMNSEFHLKKELPTYSIGQTQASSLRCRVNLALAYTELTEELGRVRGLAIKQSDLLGHLSQEPGRSNKFIFVQSSDQTET